MNNVETHVLKGFHDPIINDDTWNGLLSNGAVNVLFLTLPWQRTWWANFARGDLLLIAAYKGTSLVAIAPFFTDSGMVFFVGSGGSDYLDFIGNISDPDVLDALLTTARQKTSNFVGFRFHHVLDKSLTSKFIQESAERLRLKCFDEQSLAAPFIDLDQVAESVIQKKSLVRHQRYFEREGDLDVRNLNSVEEIMPRLEIFFSQHIKRWGGTSYPSLFNDQKQCRFYEHIVQAMANMGWLRFTELIWNDNPIAFHFGFSYQKTFLWYKPSFDIDLARRSPGEVLIRQLLFAAINEEVSIFDLGLGGEPFKQRFATGSELVRTWGVYAPEALTSKQ